MVILVLWAGAMGWHAKRLYLKTEAEELAAATRTLPPGMAYYEVRRNERQVGWAQSRIDTLPRHGGFVIHDRMVLDLASLGFGGEGEFRSRTELGPALELRSFYLEAGGAAGRLTASGHLGSDSMLVLSVDRGSGASVRRIPVDGRLLLATALPLRIAAEGGGAPGRRFRFQTFDPLTLEPRTAELRVTDRATRTYPDSAVRDSATDRWRVTGVDTVRAWAISRAVEGMEVTSWVDEDGRFLRVEVPGGFRLERTAFEIAYFGYRSSRGGPATGGRGGRAPGAPPPAGLPDSVAPGEETPAAPGGVGP